MRSLNKKKFEEQGYAIVKNVLNFDNDLKPILNDMEYVMDRLIHKFSPKPKISKALKLKFEKKYQFVSSLNIFDLDQYFSCCFNEDIKSSTLSRIVAYAKTRSELRSEILHFCLFLSVSILNNNAPPPRNGSK